MRKPFLIKNFLVATLLTTSFFLFDLKPFNLDDLFKDLEKMLEENDQDEERTRAEKDDTPEIAHPELKLDPTPSTSTTSVHMKKKDYKTLFLESIDQEDKRNSRDQQSLLLTPEHTLAYSYYMDDFLSTLKEIEKNIDASEKFTPKFKADVSTFKNDIDAIVIADGKVRSKKMYMNIFFKKSFEQLRIKILNALPSLKSLHQSILAFVGEDGNEKEEQAQDSKKLEEFAREEPSLDFEASDTVPLPDLFPFLLQGNDSVKINKFAGIEGDIRYAFSSMVKPIAEAFKDIHTNNTVKEAIEKKIKKREQRYKKLHKQMRNSRRSHSPNTPSFPYHSQSYYSPYDRNQFGRHTPSYDTWFPGRTWGSGNDDFTRNPFSSSQSHDSPSLKKDLLEDNKNKYGEPSRADDENPTAQTYDKKSKDSEKYTPINSRDHELTVINKARNLKQHVIRAMNDVMRHLKNPKSTQGKEDQSKPDYDKYLIGTLEGLAEHIKRMNEGFDNLTEDQSKKERLMLIPIYKNYLSWFVKGFWNVDQSVGNQRPACKFVMKELANILGDKTMSNTLNKDLTEYIEKKSQQSEALLKTINNSRSLSERDQSYEELTVSCLARLNNILDVLPYEDKRLKEVIETQNRAIDSLVAEGKISKKPPTLFSKHNEEI